MSATTVAAASYLSGAIALGMLTLLMLVAWRGRMQGGLLVAACGISALWCAAVAAFALFDMPPYAATELMELLRDGAWLAFLFWVLKRASGDAELIAKVRRIGVAVLAILLFTLVAVVVGRVSPALREPGGIGTSAPILGHLLLAIVGLALVEQIYRNTRPDRRWGIKFLCFGVGGLFAYDLFFYAQALLFRSIDLNLWIARGAANALAVPFIAVAARRNQSWSVEVFVSRHFVLHGAAVLGAGLYLLLMAAAGYYIRSFGGSWGGVVQAVFLFGAVMVLGVIMGSSRLRAEARIFLSKHFYRNQYDYRDEWLRFTRKLSQAGDDANPLEAITEAIAAIVESPSGTMWTRAVDGRFRPSAAWETPLAESAALDATHSLPVFLARSGWIVYLDEYRESPEAYEGLELREWLVQAVDPWVVVPLVHGEALVAFVVLARSPTKRALDWEDSDLLKTAGRQAAGYIALREAVEALAEARQFEAFNRLSAFVVHDLKNVVAQLSLVTSNARRHMHSPGFVEDAVQTVENATSKMNRMLAQLRKGRLAPSAVRSTVVRGALERVVAARSVDRPVPDLQIEGDLPRVEADADRFQAVMEHLVQNAQEATADEGEVVLCAFSQAADVVIQVRDTGCGMDARFIRERLFKPFDTTKGNAGMGVGVYETREFAQSLGGRLEVTSEPGRGTVFELRMPREGTTAATEGTERRQIGIAS